MSNSSIPPNNPNEHSNVIALSPPKKEGGDKPNPELERRRTDIHKDLTNVTEVRPGIANRRKNTDVQPPKKSRVRKNATERRKNPNFNGLDELEYSPEMASIEKGERTKKKLAVAEDQETFAEIRGSVLFERAIGGVGPIEYPLSVEDVARKLLDIRDADLQLPHWKREFTNEDYLSTDPEIFFPVAHALHEMFPDMVSRRYLNDVKVANLATLVRDPELMFQRLVSMLRTYKEYRVSFQGEPAHNAPKGGRVRKKARGSKK